MCLDHCCTCPFPAPCSLPACLPHISSEGGRTSDDARLGSDYYYPPYLTLPCLALPYPTPRHDRELMGNVSIAPSTWAF